MLRSASNECGGRTRTVPFGAGAVRSRGWIGSRHPFRGDKSRGTEVDGIVLNGRDITETLATQEALRRSQEYVREALNVARMAPGGSILARGEASGIRTASAMFGLPAVETSIGIPELVNLIHPDDRHFLSPESVQGFVESNNIDVELRAIWPDGSIHWIEARGTPSFDESGARTTIGGVIFDITDRKEIESKLHAERAILETLMNQGPDVIFIKDRIRRFVRANKRRRSISGLDDAKDLIGKTDFDLFPAEESQRYFSDEQRVMETGESSSTAWIAYPHPENGETWVLTSIGPIRNANGEITGIIGSSRDVTAYRSKTRLLAIAEMRYRLLVEQIPAITTLFSIRDGVHSYEYISPANRTHSRLHAWEYAEIWLADPESVFHPDDRARLASEIAKTNATHAAATVEYRHRVKGGGWKWLREMSQPLPGDEEQHRRWQGIIFDLDRGPRADRAVGAPGFHDPLTGLANRLLLVSDARTCRRAFGSIKTRLCLAVHRSRQFQARQRFDGSPNRRRRARRGRGTIAPLDAGGRHHCAVGRRRICRSSFHGFAVRATPGRSPPASTTDLASRFWSTAR